MQVNLGSAESLDVGSREEEVAVRARNGDIALYVPRAVKDGVRALLGVQREDTIGVDTKVHLHVFEHFMADGASEVRCVAVLVGKQHVVEKDAVIVEPDVLVVDMVAGAEGGDAHLRVKNMHSAVKIGGVGRGVDKTVKSNI